jgi:hypothetical protein
MTTIRRALAIRFRRGAGECGGHAVHQAQSAGVGFAGSKIPWPVALMRL